MDSERTVVIQNDDLDASIEELYRQLGKAYYEGGVEDPLPELLPYFDKITQLKILNNDIAYTCPQCGEEVGANQMFCGKCGYKLM